MERVFVWTVSEISLLTPSALFFFFFFSDGVHCNAHFWDSGPLWCHRRHKCRITGKASLGLWCSERVFLRGCVCCWHLWLFGWLTVGDLVRMGRKLLRWYNYTILYWYPANTACLCCVFNMLLEVGRRISLEMITKCSPTTFFLNHYPSTRLWFSVSLAAATVWQRKTETLLLSEAAAGSSFDDGLFTHSFFLSRPLLPAGGRVMHHKDKRPLNTRLVFETQGPDRQTPRSHFFFITWAEESVDSAAASAQITQMSFTELPDGAETVTKATAELFVRRLLCALD